MTNCLLWTASRQHRVGQTDQLLRVALVYGGRRLGRDTVLLEGEAPGGDTIARRFWERWSLPVRPCPADWAGPCDPAAGCTPGHRQINRHGAEYCPLAGHRRNQHMVDLAAAAVRGGAQALCVAMPRGVSSGTYDCARRAAAAGIEVWPPHVAARLQEPRTVSPRAPGRVAAIVCGPAGCRTVRLPDTG